MRIRAVLYDMDGTVMNTIEDIHDSVNETLRHFAMREISLADTTRFVGNGARRLMEQAVPKNTGEKKFEEVLEYYVNWYEDHCMIRTAPYRGIPEMMKRLKEEGLLQCVISNKPDAATREIADRFFPGLLEFSIGERDGLRRKPWPDMVDAAVSRLGFDKEECVFVGDSEVDFATARNAGLRCISVLWGFRDEQLLRGVGASEFVRTPEELEERLLFLSRSERK